MRATRYTRGSELIKLVDSSGEHHAVAMNELIKISLFSPVPVIQQNDVTIPITRSDSLDLLIYLIEEGKSDYEREALAAALFEDDARSPRLREAIFHLRRALGEAVLPIAAKEAGRLYFDRSRVQIDTQTFMAQVKPLLGTRERGTDARFLSDAQHALSIYRAHLLEGHHFPAAGMSVWLNGLRNKYSQQRDRLLDRMVQFYIQQGAFAEAQQQAEYWLESSLDPGFIPLQYLIWVTVTMRYFTEAQQYLTQLQVHEAENDTFFGPTVAEWRKLILNTGELSPALLNFSQQMTGLLSYVPVPVDFVERSDLSRTFADLLLNAAQLDVIALTGLPGVGKSSFAQSVIRVTSRINPRLEFAWVDLTGDSDIEGILNSVLSQLGMDTLMHLDFASKQRQFKNQLKPRSCVIVLDEGVSGNFAVPEFLDSVTALFAGARLVLIARMLPADRFYMFNVPPFQRPEIQSILQKLLPEQVRVLTPAMFDQLEHITGGLPLVLNLAAGFVSERRFGLSAFAEQMHQQLSASWTEETAILNYSRLLAWLWTHLGTQERLVLYTVGMYDPATGCPDSDLTHTLVSAGLMDEEAAAQTLDRLLRLRLVMKHEAADSLIRYKLHPIIYDDVQTVHERTPDGDSLRALQLAHRERIVGFVLQNYDDYARLDQYRFEIVKTLSAALAPSSEAPDIMAVRALNAAYTFFDRRGLYTTAEQLLQFALNVTGPEHPERAELLCAAGQSAFKRGHLDRALEQMHEAWELAQRYESITLRSIILRDLGRIHYQREQLDTAVDYLEQGLQTAVADQQPVIEAQIMANLGMINNVRGRPEAAAQWFERISAKFGQDSGGGASNDFGDVIQYVETQLGIMALDRDDYDQADRHFQQAKEQARRQNNPERLARSYLSLGTVSFFRSDFNAARGYFVQGNVVAEYIQHGELLAWFAWNKGAIYVIEGNYKRAGWLLRDALHKANDFGIKNALPNIFVWMGLMHLCQSQTDRARAYFLQVLNQPTLPRARIAAYALYGLALASRYEHDLTISADPETAQQEINQVLADAGLTTSMFSVVAPADIEGAHAYLKIALTEIPELERFHITEGLIGWLMSDVHGIRLVGD